MRIVAAEIALADTHLFHQQDECCDADYACVPVAVLMCPSRISRRGTPCTLRKIISGLTALAFAPAAMASVDSSPKPGGVYRLEPGIYVQKGVSCEAAPNAAIRQYDRRGISSAHTRACRAHILSRRGNRYEVSQSCIDAGSGPAARFTERQTVSVADALTFTLKTRGTGTTYRYCPAYMLPADLRGAAQQG